MAFRQIAVSPAEMYQSAAHVNDGLVQGIQQFDAEFKEISGKLSEANLLHKFNVNNWQQVFKDATPGSVGLAKNLAQIGIAHDSFTLEQQKVAAIQAARDSEDNLYKTHGWDFVDTMAQMQGSVALPDREITEELTDPESGMKQVGSYTEPGKVLWDPKSVVAKLRAAYGDMPLSKSAVAELSDLMQKGYSSASTLAWHTLNDTTRRDISDNTLQTRRDLAANKPTPASPEEKDTLAFNSKQRILAAANGVNFDELVPDKTGRLQPPARVRAAGGWDSFKQNALKQRMTDRLGYERETRVLIQKQAQEFQSKKAEAALDAKDKTALQRETDKRYADLRKHIEGDMTDKEIFDYDASGEKKIIPIPGDEAGTAYWRRLSAYTSADIMNFAVGQRDENALYTWLTKTYMIDPATGRIGETIPPGVDEALSNLARAATSSTNDQFRAFASSVDKSVSLPKFKQFLRDDRALDEMIPAGK